MAMVMMIRAPERRPDWHGERVKLAENRESDQGSADSDKQQNRVLWGTHTY
jgi:hypothetical protein